MRAGKLDQRLTIQTKTATRDAMGQPVETWADTKTVWGEAITGGGGEFYAAQKLFAETKVVFRVRYDSSITTTQRIEWLGRYYQILSVPPPGQYREILIACKEVA